MPTWLLAQLKGKGITDAQVIDTRADFEDCFIDAVAKMTLGVITMNNRHPIISVKNLVKKFGDFVANDHLSFEVYEGEIFGFLGANGAGKTTAIRILCGLSYPTSGKLDNIRIRCVYTT